MWLQYLWLLIHSGGELLAALIKKEGKRMPCQHTCKLCRRLILSQSVTYTSGVLTINIPAGSYNNGEKYCIVIAQPIPSDAIIGAPVVITIGDGTVNYPLTKCNCAQATVCSIRTRTRYATVVSTSATGGSFRLLGRTCCAPDYAQPSIDGTTTTT